MERHEGLYAFLLFRAINRLKLITNPCIDDTGAQNKAHKRVVTRASRCEGVYNGADLPSVVFCERGAFSEEVKPFFERKTVNREEKCDEGWRCMERHEGLYAFLLPWKVRGMRNAECVIIEENCLAIFNIKNKCIAFVG